MLKPKTDRLSYSEMLKPPEGYRLGAAVGTTYSLDLETLVAASLPMAIAENPERDILENPICVMHSMRKVSDRVVLFCEDGQTKLPRAASKLLSFFERMIVRVDLPKFKNEALYPSFHPKMWFVDFINAYGEHHFRLIVLSRNLTFDRSWDVGVVLESERGATGKQKGIRNRLSAFLAFLKSQIPGRTGEDENNRKRQIIQGMINALPSISFAYEGESDWNEIELLPLGIGEGAARMEDFPLFSRDENDSERFKLQDAIVVSPFISKSVIEHLGRMDRRLANGTSALITREGELPKLMGGKKDVLGAFADHVYVLKDRVIDGESRISDDGIDEPHRQDLHAKIYLWRRYDRKEMFIGSMNASERGLHRNVELVLHFLTQSRCVNGSRFLADLFGEDGAQDNPFKKAEFDEAVVAVDEDAANSADRVLKDFCRVARVASVSKSPDGLYCTTVRFSPRCSAGEELDGRIYLRPLHWRGQAQRIQEEMSFARMTVDDLSMYYEVSIRLPGQKPLNRLLLIQTADIPPERDTVITNSVIKDAKALASYLMMALTPGRGQGSAADPAEMLTALLKGNASGGVELGLYEKMLRAASENPDGFRDVQRVLSLVSDDDAGKKEIKDLYQLFFSTLVNEGVLHV